MREGEWLMVVLRFRGLVLVLMRWLRVDLHRGLLLMWLYLHGLWRLLHFHLLRLHVLGHGRLAHLI